MLAAHVLALDPVSWQVVLGELDATLHALMAGNAPAPVREHTSYRRWVDAMTTRADIAGQRTILDRSTRR